MASTIVEILKKDMLGINQIMNQDDKGQRQFRKCHNCNRPAFGHSKPGCGENRCKEAESVSDQESINIWKELYAAKEGMFAMEI